MTARLLADANVRPYAIFVATVLLLALVDIGAGRFLTWGTAFSVMQLFAMLGPVALGLGLSMMIREFDLSVAGMFGLAGCIAVLTGVDDPLLGILCALAVGLAGGVVQGLIITGLRLSSVGVTLGGLLTFTGLAYVLTEARALSYPNIDVALMVNEPVLGILSPRSMIAIVIFLIAAFVISHTRIGRDVIAMGSDRRASEIAGVNTDRLLVGVIAVSGALAALSGALLSYGLAAASPAGLSEVLVPAAAAAILGGVSLSGGTGRPLGIAVGVLILCLLRSGLNAVGASPYVHDIATGCILLAVAILDGPALGRRITELRLRLGGARAG